MCSSSYFKTISRILIIAMLHLCWTTSYGWADMVPTESILEQPSQDATDRQRILDLLDREEVVDELGKYGISNVEAVARINSFFGPSGCSRVIVNGKVVSESPGCDDGPDAGVVLAVIGILILVVIFFIWLFRKAKVYSPSSKEAPSSETVVEEVCDPADVTALIMGSCD